MIIKKKHKTAGIKYKDLYKYKGVYPYKYMDAREKFIETVLPEK